MKQKHISIALLFIFSILCAVAYIGYNYFSKNIGAFKNLSPKQTGSLLAIVSCWFFATNKGLFFLAIYMVFGSNLFIAQIAKLPPSWFMAVLNLYRLFLGLEKLIRLGITSVSVSP